ncbi:MAG: hypothetical protein IPM12_11055 [Flavobacteriales bacterium]|nr:hypothetical protein [Flavobacteriales bacterium]
MLTAFLDWFEEHKAGVIGALALHTLFLFICTFIYMPSVPREDQISDMRIEMISDLEAEEIQQRIQDEDDGVPEKVTALTSNITAEVKPSFSQAKLAERVENDLRALEQAEFERLEEERKARGEEDVDIPELDPSKWDHERYLSKPAEPVKVEGAALVEHDLRDRVRGDAKPGYLCKEQGRVVVRVEVDRNGRVRKAELDKAGTNTTDECMLELALRSAKETPFSPSSSAPDPHRGIITFRFVQQ